jgi:anti-sigma factor RsiW
MECDKIQEILPAYLEGLASPAESEMVSSHLASCPECNSTVKALMKSQKLIANLEDVEPPPWLKTRIMARLEEGIEQEEAEGWSFRRLKDLLLYPLKVKIPLQAFAVLVVAVVAVYVYKTTQPELQTTVLNPKSAATLSPSAEKKDSDLRLEGAQKPERNAAAGTRQSQEQSPPESPAKLGAEEGRGWPSGIREIFKASPARQPAPSQTEKASESTVKDQDSLQTASEPETTKKAKSAKMAPANVPHATGVPAPTEELARSTDAKTEVEKGKSIISGASHETVTLTIQVADIKAGTSDAEAVLRSLGASVAKEAREGSSLLSSEVSSSKAKEIVRRLGTVGQVQQKGQLSDQTSDKPVSLRIHVLQKQP